MTFDEATRALYLDAGDSGSAPPVILGVLSPDQRFTQWIVSVDRGDVGADYLTMPVVTPAEALHLIASQSRAAGARAWGWSRSILPALAPADAEADQIELLAGPYERMVDVAVRWARSYPGLTVSRERDGSSEQMRACIRLAGYRPDRPEVMKARGLDIDGVAGRLPSHEQVTTSGWQRRLDDNRHDCLGLRHLMLRATAEIDKRAAYLDTVYSVRDRDHAIEFFIGSRTAALDLLVRSLGAGEWAHVSACDPGLLTLPAADNERRSTTLAGIARQRGYTVLDGAGQDRERRRPPEHTCFIAGMPAAEARALAREFGQWAIVTGMVGEAATLEWCLDGGADPLIVNQLGMEI